MADFGLSTIIILSFSVFIGNLRCLSAHKRAVYSTKTAYAWVVDVEKPVIEDEFITTDYQGRRCFAVRLESVVRHGARFPGYKDIRKMTELHHKLKLTVKKPGFEFLQSWENDFPEEQEKQLVDEGEEEQFGLGLRYGKRFKGLFKGDIDNIKFYSSSKDRSRDSALSFYEGLTEAILHEAYDNLTYLTKDNLMRFHTTCEKFIHTIENNRTHMQYQKMFKKSEEMKKVIQNVKERLGLEHYQLDAGELKLIFFWCTFEMIIHGQDHWCHMLSDEDKEVMEYHNDLKQFWKKAYGHPVIGGMACPLVQALFEGLDKAAEKNLNHQHQVGESAAFYFGHAETLGPLYTALGLFNDLIPLKHDNYQEMRNRSFKSSLILPFSANIAIVLYKCDHPDRAADSIEDYVLRFYVNEQPVKIPACQDYVCRYQDVKKSYYEHTDGCDFKKICSLNAHDEL